jgi:hypothetical protein
VAVLVNPVNASTETTLRDVEAAARTMGLHIQVRNASTSLEIIRCGLLASDRYAAGSRGMSASPPIATELMLYRELTRSAKTSTSQTGLWLRRTNVWRRVTSPTWGSPPMSRYRQGDGNVVTTFAVL